MRSLRLFAISSRCRRTTAAGRSRRPWRATPTRAEKRSSLCARAALSRPTDPAYRRGLEFLLRTQIADGSWLVETHAVPIQAYFESGFPYGVNQMGLRGRDGMGDDGAGARHANSGATAFRGRPRRRRDRRAPKTAARRRTATRRLPSGSGQTRAPLPAKTAAFAVETAAEGLSGAFCFAFLPDGRIIVGERPGRIRIVSRRRERVGAARRNARRSVGAWAGAVRSRVRIARSPRTARSILTYTVLPEGANPGGAAAQSRRAARRAARHCRRTSARSRT